MKTIAGARVLIFVVSLSILSCITISTSAPNSSGTPPIISTSTLIPFGTMHSMASTPTPMETMPPIEAHINLQGNPNWNWQQISPPTITPKQKSIITTLDDRGYLHLFWDGYLSSGNAFIYHTYYNGVNWTPPIPVSLTLGNSDLRAVSLINSNGIIHLLWYNQLKSGGPFRLMYASFDGTSWSPESEIISIEKDPNLRGVLSVDEKGVHAIVRTPNIMSPNINYLTFSGTGWGVPEVITPPSVGLYLWDYYPDNTGGIRFYGKDVMNNKLTYAYRQNGQTAVQNTDVVFPRYEDAFIDAQGNHFTYWTGSVPIPGGTVEGAYYQCIDSNLTIWREQVLSGEMEIITKPIVAQSTSKTAMLWINKDQQTNLLLPKSCPEADLFSLPLPPIEKSNRKPLALAISDIPSKICIVSNVGYSNTPLEVYCADMP